MKRLYLAAAALALAACSQKTSLDPTLIDRAESTYADARMAAGLHGVSEVKLAPLDAQLDVDVEAMRGAYAKGDGQGYVEASLKATRTTFAVLSLAESK